MKRLPLDSTQTAWCLSAGIRFFLCAALTAGTVFGGYTPFALGLLAAAGGRAKGFFALLGAGTGALLFLNFSDGLSFLATGILIYSTAVAFETTKLLQKSWFMPTVSAGLFFAVKLIYLLQAPRFADNLFPAIAAALLVGLSARLYAALLGEEGVPHPLSLLFLAVTLLMGLTGLMLPGGVSCGRLLACCLLLYVAYTQGMGVGVPAGVCIGLAMDFSGGSGGLFFSAAYGIGALLAGWRAGQGRLSAAGCYALGTLLLLLPSTEKEGVALLTEALFGTVLFLLLPGRLFGGKRIQRERPVSAESSPILERLREQLNASAAAFRELYDSFGRGESTHENPAVVFDRAAEQVCRGCALCDICWQKEYGGTFTAMNDATPLLLERGRVLAKDFPPQFSGRCIHLPELLTAINGELSAFLLRRQYRLRLEETRRSAKGQYAQMSELLSSTAAHLEGATQAFSQHFTYQIGAALRPKEGETVSGDSLSSFETKDGTLYLLLSDGMGSGETARRESAMTARLLERFLRAGIAPEAALLTLNAALGLRSGDTGSFTTIDLLSLQLKTGEAALYKYGAAPSYLKRGGRVRRITGGNLPAGLDSQQADVTRFPVEPDSFVVLVSDGVTDAGHDEWLQNLLAGWQGDDPQTLVGLILAESKQLDGMEDDCGVQILYLPAQSAGGLGEV
ncbi:MAG: SpoIIE family protein phosphatase [Oscillospiraceae bacterium]